VPLHILHIDPHDRDRKLELVDLEVVVERAPSQEEALRHVGETDFDAIVIDAADEPAARSLAEKLRSRARSRTTPILLFTDKDVAALRVTEGDARFRTMFEQGTRFASILSLDGAVVEANRICLEGCGFTRADVIGKPFWECGWWRPLPWLSEMIRKAFEHARDGHLFRTETTYFVADGSERYVDLILAPVTAEDGRVLFVVPTGLDITDRRRAQERLRLLYAIGECARPATDPAEVMATTTRLVGEHLRATSCAYADVDSNSDRFTIRDDWTMGSVSRSIGVYSLDRVGRRVAADLRAGRTVVVNDVGRELRADGADMFRQIGIQAVICCPLLRGSRLVAMMAVHQATPREWLKEEVTFVDEVVERSWAHIERIRDSESLREQYRRKDKFLATLAHELRNPLAPIRTGLEVLKRTAKIENPAALKARDIMDRQLGHMVRLIDDLLDVSRISRGKVELKRERIQIRTVVDHALDASRPLLEAARHRLMMEVPDDAIWVDGDLTRLAQVISNLLNNAAKYTLPGGTIRLTVTASSDDVIVRVIDSGAGIAHEMLSEIFDLFAQANRMLDRAQGGLGIGLSLVRMLVEMHDGTVVADSEGLGKGSTFTVRLPIHPLASGHSSETNAEDSRTASTRRILVVDDNVDGAETLAMMLELAGHETLMVHDGEGVLAAAQSFLPDLVFLDIGLPGIDGYEVAGRLRADAKLHNVMLVALTGFAGEDDKRRTKEAGFDLHLTKPVTCSMVEDAIARVA
jgi:PAS domain S-box-containing protein